MVIKIKRHVMVQLKQMNGYFITLALILSIGYVSFSIYDHVVREAEAQACLSSPIIMCEWSDGWGKATVGGKKNNVAWQTEGFCVDGILTRIRMVKNND